MGYIRHNAIVVTCWNNMIETAAAKAAELGLPVVGPGPEVINGYRSMLVGPDGSKEGWADSERCDEARDAFVRWMESTLHEDGSGPLDWVELRYGGDEPERVEIMRHYGQERGTTGGGR